MSILAFLYGMSFFSIEPISSRLKEQMIRANSWREGCPVRIEDLRLIRVPYLGFDNREHIGNMIVHKSVASEVLEIFKELKEIGYPIENISLVSEYRNKKELLSSNITSSFNCRLMTGSRYKWSKHSYGKAIDINPTQNPYIRKSTILPIEGKKYIGKKRAHTSNKPSNRAIILKDDKIVKIFKKYGWIWGGDWKSLKDYHHFEKRYNYSFNKKKKSIKKLFKRVTISEDCDEAF